MNEQNSNTNNDDGLVRQHIEPCPCGETPTALLVEVERSQKRGHTFGSCCGDWIVEFNNNYTADKDKIAEKARIAWNRAPRVSS